MTAPVHSNIAYPAPGGRTLRGLRDPVDPHVIVLFGATGDLSRRKLLPGLDLPGASALTPDIQVIGTSLDDIDDEASAPSPTRPSTSSAPARSPPSSGTAFAQKLHYVPQSAGPDALGAGGQGGRGAARRRRCRRLHYLSVPPKAAVAVIEMLGTPASSTAPASSWRSRSAPT